jgi:anti-anti-sigma factor
MFRLETVSSDETILIAIGPISGESAADFGKKIEALIGGRGSTVTLDLSQVPAMNSEAIGKLLLLRKKLAEQKRTLRIQGCSDPMWRIFKTIKLDTLIPMQQ